VKISYRGDYALKAVLDLALHYNQGVATIHDLAKRTDAPVKFLEQVLLDLKKGGFVDSRRGINGGYLLSRHPKTIKLGEVIRFVDGPIEPIACVEKGYAGCNNIYNCVLRKVCREVAEATAGIIDNVTFEDLANETGVAREGLAYSI
jgi:Rrf2 family transcriptional regulator, cysteine metabolism repressor